MWLRHPAREFEAVGPQIPNPHRTSPVRQHPMPDLCGGNRTSAPAQLRPGAVGPGGDHLLVGGGRRPQNLNPDALDWAHEYSFWAATSVLQQAEATGDVAGLRA